MDECGVWLSSDFLDVDTWIAALKGYLKFRMTASVVSDQRLGCEISDGPVGSTAAVIDNVVTLPRRFSYRKVSAQSIFHNSQDAMIGVADESDDSTALYEFMRTKAQLGSEAIENINLQTPSLALQYDVADSVTAGPESRDLGGVKSDNRAISWIERVQMDFQKQCTNLKIVRQRSVTL